MSNSSLKNPWVIRGEKPVYENGWIRLTEYDVLNPVGNPALYGVVSFKNKAVGIAPIEDGHIWLVGQHRFPLDLYSWEIPEGGSPEGETTLSTAHRELAEEAGLKAETLTSILTMHLSNSLSDEWAEVFLATDLSPCEAAPEDSEDITIAKVSLDEFFARVESGEITDAITVATAYKLMVLRARGEI